MSTIVHGWSRLREAALPLSASLRWGAACLMAVTAGAGWVATARPPKLPQDAKGTLVFVSDRDGIDALYVRRLPDGRERRLTQLDEPVREPALSPDGARAAFVVGGRLGVVDLGDGRVHILTLGQEWKDGTPSWAPDGRGIVVAARRTNTAMHDIHLLSVSAQVEPARRPLTATAHVDESSPVVTPDGTAVVFVRDDNLYRFDLAGARATRLTGGFRKARSPRFLPSGRIVFLWTEAKTYGIDVVDIDGKNRETLHEGSVFYRTAVPSPDGRYLAATFTFDLGFRFWTALGLGHREELQLLDLHGERVAELAASWRHGNHTAAWAR